jgi:hypothetical protein
MARAMVTDQLSRVSGLSSLISSCYRHKLCQLTTWASLLLGGADSRGVLVVCREIIVQASKDSFTALQGWFSGFYTSKDVEGCSSS